MMRGLQVDALGLEIGPSFSPVAPRSKGYRVEIMDVVDSDALRAKYAGQGVELGAIEEVDFLLDGRGFADLTGKPRGYAWIIASHVIEHVPDFVGFLAECESVLREDGILSLAVPDMRHSFDRLRMPTSIQAVVDAHLEKRTRHTRGRAVDYYLNVVSLAGLTAWTPAIARREGDESLAFFHNAADAIAALRMPEAELDIDIHAWCFTPSSFRLLLSDLHAIGLTGLRERDFAAHENEFLVKLSRQGEGAQLSRIELLRRVESELGLGGRAMRGRH